MQNGLIGSTVNLTKVLVRAFIANQKLTTARELVEAMRMACDELTVEINAASKKQLHRG